MELNGTWERRGRSLNSAAIAALLGVGILYFYGQSLIVGGIMFWAKAHEPSGGTGFIQHLTSLAEVTKDPVRISLSLTQFALMLLPTCWLIKRWHTTDVPAYVRFRPASASQIALAFCTIVFFFPANLLVSEVLFSALHVPEALVKINQTVFTAANGSEFVLVVLVIAVTPAICEEVLFRGYAQRTLERTMGLKSVLLVGVLFGLYHMQPLGLLSLSALGLVFGYFYYASRSLLPGIVAHFTNNFFAVLWLYLMNGTASGTVRALHERMPFIAALTLPIAGFAFYLFHRATVRRELGPRFAASIR